ncbi:pyridoxal phosphate-dependent aminotransferase [Paenibacillus swuensis]|uniref:Pyridoxal phosphate-dependent aminotransferase n=1 Tax=Paenibacillus swuensis TaxID=1178515 RepID=A0A172TED1_9BACL|nr:aminotransferase class I/II-fold pyridoxal phosphate-dependent enzyme [Paenibacillus swuensis]ANE45409.1 pyridoxal phosphate-dependent aminotransferase [Paenibacillus swuensis]
MHENRIYLSAPHMSGYEEAFVQKAFATNWISTVGPQLNAFEQAVAEYAGAAGAVALNSGTSAIHLALRLADVQAGDTVFCSSLTFVASANPIVQLGATPVFIDSDPESWNMSIVALEEALYDAYRAGVLPKAVVVVNLYGQSADYDPILELCNRYGVSVIEDAAESLGAHYKGKASGTLGRYGIYSFNGNKIITTSGGGMLVSDRLEDLEKARFWATQAREQCLHYEHKESGYNYRMSNVLAGVGQGQLKVLDDRVARKREIFESYRQALGKLDGFIFMPECSYGRSTRWLTTLTIDPEACGLTALDFVHALAELHIESRPVWKPLHAQPLFEGCRYYRHGQTGTSDRLYHTGLCLPSGTGMTDADMERVIESMKTIYKRRRSEIKSGR